MLARHDPRRNDALGLVRRTVATGSFTKGDIEKWSDEIGKEAVEAIVSVHAPAPEPKKKDAPKTE